MTKTYIILFLLLFMETCMKVSEIPKIPIVSSLWQSRAVV